MVVQARANDQVRFELSVMAIDLEIKVLAPWRFWNIKSRSEELAYAKKYNIKVTDTN